MFKNASGQQVNLMKSTVFYSSNVIQSNRDMLSQILHMVDADDKGTYLGLPNMMSRNKSTTLGFLKDKIRRVQT